MQDNPIKVHVIIAISAVVKGRSVEEIERDCNRLQRSIIDDMRPVENTTNVAVRYQATEINSAQASKLASSSAKKDDQ